MLYLVDCKTIVYFGLGTEFRITYNINQKKPVRTLVNRSSVEQWNDVEEMD
jgi:hypothetical protein